jgi:hypothetical protein
MSSQTSGSGGRARQGKPRPKKRAASRSEGPQIVQKKQNPKEKREEAQKRRKREMLEYQYRCADVV